LVVYFLCSDGGGGGGGRGGGRGWGGGFLFLFGNKPPENREGGRGGRVGAKGYTNILTLQGPPLSGDDPNKGSKKNF